MAEVPGSNPGAPICEAGVDRLPDPGYARLVSAGGQDIEPTPVIGLLASLGACALIGVVTEIVAVRPVLKSLEQHLYVLSTLALALMIRTRL